MRLLVIHFLKLLINFVYKAEDISDPLQHNYHAADRGFDIGPQSSRFFSGGTAPKAINLVTAPSILFEQISHHYVRDRGAVCLRAYAYKATSSENNSQYQALRRSNIG
jgi:hypothetical protein